MHGGLVVSALALARRATPAYGVPMLSRLRYLSALALCCPAITMFQGLAAERQIERLGRGLVALKLADGGAYLGWRLLATDPEHIAFNVYRPADGATPVTLPTEAPAGPYRSIPLKKRTATRIKSRAKHRARERICQ